MDLPAIVDRHMLLIEALALTQPKRVKFLNTLRKESVSPMSDFDILVASTSQLKSALQKAKEKV